MDALPSPSVADLLGAKPVMKLQGTRNEAAAAKAAEDFEAMFLGEMLQPMFSTVEVNETFGGGSAEEMWRGLMVEEMSKQIARQGGLGIAPMVKAQILKMQEVNDGTQ